MWKIQTLMPQLIARHVRRCLYLKLHPGMILVRGWNYSCRWWNVSYCLHVFAEMKFHSGMKSSLSMVKYLLLFTRFCRDEISSRDELIPVKKTETKFHPGMKKKTCKHFISGWNFKMSMIFLKNFLTCVFKHAFQN